MDWDKVDVDPLQFLVGPQGSKEFLEEVWEQKPHVFKATPERKAFFQGLVTFKQLKALATQKEEEGDPLAFGEDINAARYVDGVRETPNGDVADAETLKDLFVREGCTMQLHQPQRFVDDLWRLMASMERQLGCLVGCNAYLTPKHTQGLAPHWDDVEIFVIQTEGSKRWSLYRPKEGPYAHSMLANHCSGDLEDGDLGQPFMEFILEAGDVLYMPRGTIHQACALSSHSSHLTISTFQRWAWGDLMQYAVGVCLANPQLQPTLPAAVRAGLPLRWLEAAGFCRADVPPLGSRAATTATGGQCGKAAGGKGARGKAAGGLGAQGGSEARGKLVSQLAVAFRKMADWLEAGEGEQVPAGEKALLAASCAMSEDFMRNRLPPHPDQLPDPGPEPSGDDDVVACRGQGLFLPVPLSPDDHPETGSDSESDEDMSCGEEENGPHGGGGAAGAVGGAGTKWVRLRSCLGNDREGHMMSGGPGGEGGCDEEGGCCSMPGCEHDHGHDHHHHHHDEHGHGSSSDEEEEEEEEGAEGDSSDEGEGEEGAEAAAAAAAAAGGKKRPGSAGQKRKEREGAEEEDAAEIQSGSDIEDISLDALMEGAECCGEEEGVEEDIVLPIALAPALLQLLGTDARAGKGMRIGDLMAGGAEVRRDLAAALWGSGVLCVLPCPVEAPAPEAEAKGEEEQGQEEGKGSKVKKKGKGKGEKEGGKPSSAGKKGSGGSKKAKA